MSRSSGSCRYAGDKRAKREETQKRGERRPKKERSRRGRLIRRNPEENGEPKETKCPAQKERVMFIRPANVRRRDISSADLSSSPTDRPLPLNCLDQKSMVFLCTMRAMRRRPVRSSPPEMLSTSWSCSTQWATATLSARRSVTPCTTQSRLRHPRPMDCTSTCPR